MLFCGFLSGPGLNQVTSTFWSVTQSLLGGEQATIPHLKEDSQGFRVTPISEIFLGKEACYGPIIPLPKIPLVTP